jgi:transposase
VTIPAIGEATAAILIAELFNKHYASARQAAAFAGLVPRLVESGTF